MLKPAVISHLYLKFYVEMKSKFKQLEITFKEETKIQTVKLTKHQKEVLELNKEIVSLQQQLVERNFEIIRLMTLLKENNIPTS